MTSGGVTYTVWFSLFRVISFSISRMASLNFLQIGEGISGVVNKYSRLGKNIRGREEISGVVNRYPGLKTHIRGWEVKAGWSKYPGL